jgi:hypothetical protein
MHLLSKAIIPYLRLVSLILTLQNLYKTSLENVQILTYLALQLYNANYEETGELTRNSRLLWHEQINNLHMAEEI